MSEVGIGNVVVHWTRPEYEDYLASLSAGAGLKALALEAAAAVSLVFGLADEDRWMFTEHSQKLIEYFHGLYRSRQSGPTAECPTRDFILFAETYCGGMPPLEMRDEVTRRFVQHCMQVMKNSRNKLGPFVPPGDANQKRNKVLDDLNSLDQGRP